MTGKNFFKKLANGKTDAVSVLLSLLKKIKAEYCVIGGLAVNAYAEPVVSLDLDLVVISGRLDDLRRAAKARGIKLRAFAHSLNLDVSGSDLRIQVQTDPRYQDFIARAVHRNVLGYRMSVAALDDLFQGKIWAYSDKTRRPSKRQKDLADILRLVETHPRLERLLPPKIAARIE
jgi:hypothetical protein